MEVVGVFDVLDELFVGGGFGFVGVVGDVVFGLDFEDLDAEAEHFVVGGGFVEGLVGLFVGLHGETAVFIYGRQVHYKNSKLISN